MTDRTLKDAMRRVLDITFSDLAYNIAFRLKDAQFGTHTVHWHETVKVGPFKVPKKRHRERQEPVPVQAFQAASIIVSIVPIVCIYPFIQRYFVKGALIGSLK